jgi:MFS family permease
VLLAGPAGRLADRVESRALLIRVSLAQAAVAAALAFVGGPAAILALTTLLGTGFAFAQPAEFALVPVICGEKEDTGRESCLSSANGLVEFARYAGFAAGPALGGLLAAAGSARLALLANALTFLAVSVLALRLRARRPGSSTAGRAASEAGGERSGLRALFADHELALVMAVAFFSLLFMTSNWAAMPFFTTEDLHAGQFGYGALLSLWTAGMAVGALGAAPRVRASALVTAIIVATAVQGSGLGAPAVVLSLPLAFAAFFAGGFGHGMKNTLARTMIHTRVPEAERGRAFAAYNALRNGAELLALLGGALLVSAGGARLTVLLAGALSAAVALAGLSLRDRPLPARLRTAPARA